LLLPASAARAQPGPPDIPPPALKAWDATGVIAWHNVSTDDREWYSQRDNLFLAGASIGRYWTEHVKTEVEVAVTNTLRFTGPEVDYGDAPFYYIYANQRLQRVKVSGLVVYQFLHNAWWHPFVGAGIDVDRDRRDVDRPAQRVPRNPYSAGPGTPIEYTDVPALSRSTSAVKTRGMVVAGYKAYVSQHAFFRNDLRWTIDGDVNQVTARFGFGIDF
jgi:hypothetical protein